MIAYVESLLIFIGLGAILASSLNLMLGYGGMFSAAHAVFYGIGAYTASLLALHVSASILLALPAAMFAGAVAGALLAIPALRVKEEYFVVASLGFQIIASTIFNQWVSVTGGIGGLAGIPPASFLGYQVDSYHGYLLIVVLSVAAVMLGLTVLVRSSFGRALRALRDEEAALRALGRDPVRLRIVAVIVSAMLAALAGVIYAYFTSFVNPESFSLDESVRIMVMVIIGGAGSLLGPILGATFITAFPALLTFLQVPSTALGPAQRVVYGVVITLLMIYEPEGLLGLLHRVRRRMGSGS